MINRIHGGNIWAYSKDKKVIDFSANINPLGFPDRVKEVIAKNVDSLLHYPEPEADHLKNYLASFHGLKTENFLAGNGSIEFIYLIPKALEIENALIVVPTFSEYEIALRSNRAKINFVKAYEPDNFKIDISKIKKYAGKVDLIFLCNPNNPTGVIIPKEEILELLDYCKKSRTVVAVDEAFLDFVQNSENLSLVREVGRNKNLLVLRSLTKFYGIPGLRLGYLAGHKGLIKKLHLLQNPWNVNTFAQAVLKEILEDKDHFKKTKEFIVNEKAYLFNNISKIDGIKTYYPNANFLLCKLENAKIKNSEELDERLKEKGVLIRGCANFRGLGDKYFRVAVRKRSENKKLINALKGILNDKG